MKEDNFSNAIRQEIREKIKNILPIDNTAFIYFARDKRFCEEFLRVILEDDKLIVVDNEPQKFIPNLYFKSSVLDMLCKLGDGRIVNVEIQLYDEKDHARRIYYYASMIRQAFVKKGTSYNKVNDIIIIYLTKDDIFKKGSTLYEVDMSIVSDRKEYISKWDCGLRVLYVNTTGITNKDIKDYLKLLVDDISYNEKKYPVTSDIKKNIVEKGESSMSVWMEEMMEKCEAHGLEIGREEGREEGRAAGREEGRVAGTTNTLKDLVEKGFITIENAAKQMNVSVEKFKEMIA